MNDSADRTKHTAGWISLAAAIVIALAATGEVVVTAKSGSTTLILSLVGSFLGFAAAAFGLASYDKVVDSRVAMAQFGKVAGQPAGQAGQPAQAKPEPSPKAEDAPASPA